MRKVWILLPLTVLAAACQGTWVMYDPAQQDHVYFTEAKQTHIASFALIPDDEIRVTTNVYVMGTPADHDRSFKVQFLEAEPGEVLESGGITYPVRTARPGVDFDLSPVVIPSGAVSTSLTVTLKRTPEMLQEGLMKVGIRLLDNEEFLSVAPDSSSTGRILTPYFYVYVNDGEPACPSWWRNTSGGVLGWHFNLGNFYPEKYRYLLRFFHETETTNPSFFAWATAAYGYYLDTPDLAYYTVSSVSPSTEEGRKADMMNTFWRKRYASAWARYVFIPLYEHYKEYYASHPDDPNWEPIGTVNQNARIGWADPNDSGFGFFN